MNKRIPRQRDTLQAGILPRSFNFGNQCLDEEHCACGNTAVIQLYVADEYEGTSIMSFGLHHPIGTPLWLPVVAVLTGQ